jgi:hypothetical protein
LGAWFGAVKERAVILQLTSEGNNNRMFETSTQRSPRTTAQWYCLLTGAVLLLVGIFGFVADRSFDTGSDPSGGSFLGFEVNGWHNLVHLASGVLLLAAANTRPTAKTTAIGFGFVYGLVALWGLIDGESVLGVIPVNGADNVLHILLSVAGIAAGITSATTKREQLRGRARKQQTAGDPEDRLPASPSGETRRPEGAPTGSGLTREDERVDHTAGRRR